jgi:hypothetical protein
VAEHQTLDGVCLVTYDRGKKVVYARERITKATDRFLRAVSLAEKRKAQSWAAAWAKFASYLEAVKP